MQQQQQQQGCSRGAPYPSPSPRPGTAARSRSHPGTAQSHPQSQTQPASGPDGPAASMPVHHHSLRIKQLAKNHGQHSEQRPRERSSGKRRLQLQGMGGTHVNTKQSNRQNGATLRLHSPPVSECSNPKRRQEEYGPRTTGVSTANSDEQAGEYAHLSSVCTQRRSAPLPAHIRASAAEETRQ
ncbi:hypothetical protein L226DRAFT_540775 [Lentinus tigrinus ALCF2SS1-7]|uniref:uncharacterized protein n=1 Tax=Lentinus tigrinus ALCF2SS1-7 TaxID=1328758 RepID=UPI001165D7FA|nr:hypothetical protein L226DRAFT_540775 [Lentinus tigrinus ALCF2SS1-7]